MIMLPARGSTFRRPTQALLLSVLLCSTFAFPSFLEDLVAKDRFDLSPFSFTDEFYEAQDAEFKLNTWWEFIKEKEGTKSTYKPRLLVRMMLENLSPAVDFERDYRPWRHGKSVHQIGAVAKVAFDVVQSHNLTGLFQEGSQHGLIRLGGGGSPSAQDFAPGVGFKLFRDGASSSNFVCLTEGFNQKSLNFFELVQSTQFTSPEGIPGTILEAKFATASKPSTFVGVSDFARRNSTGASLADEEIVSPFRLFLDPNPELKSDFADVESHEELDEKLESIPSGTLLYQMYGVENPFSKYPEDRFLIGNITTASEIVFSQNSDQYLFFKHQRITDDLDLDESWSEAVCPGKLSSQ